MKSLTLKSIESISKELNSFYEACDKVASRNYFTNVYGVCRSMMAMGTLLTLVFNNTYTLFAERVIDEIKISHTLQDINLFYMVGFESVWVAKLISIIILALVVSGYIPRITGILHWWVSFSFFNSCLVADGGDQITSVLTLLLIPITLMDGRNNHWNNAIQTSCYKNFTAFILFSIMELQVAVVYLQAGIEKPYKVAEWVDGTAIYYWLNHNVYGASPAVLAWMDTLLDYPFIVSLFTWGAILFELLLFGVFFMARNRRVKLLKLVLAFHFTIIIFHGLPSFFFAMAAAATLYLTPKEWSLHFQKYRLVYVKRATLIARNGIG